MIHSGSFKFDVIDEEGRKFFIMLRIVSILSLQKVIWCLHIESRDDRTPLSITKLG